MFFSILVAILVLLSTILLNSMFVLVGTEDSNYELYENMLDKNGIYVPVMNSTSTADSIVDVVGQYADEIDVYSVTRLYCAEGYTIQGLNIEFLNDLSIDIVGEMPYVSEQGEAIPIITNKGAIGDTYEIYTTYVDDEPLKFITVGIMTSPYPSFAFSGGIALSDTVLWNNGILDTVFLFATEALPYAENGVLNTASSSFVVAKDSVSDMRAEEIFLAFGKVTQVLSFEEILDYQTDRVSTFSNGMMPFLLSITAIAVANFFMCAILTNINNKKMFATLYVSGACKKHLIGIVLCAGLILSFIPTMLGSLLCIFINPISLITGATASILLSLGIALAVTIVFIMLCMLAFVFTIKQDELADCLKEAD